jgi:hypothetical protein
MTALNLDAPAGITAGVEYEHPNPVIACKRRRRRIPHSHF